MNSLKVIPKGVNSCPKHYKSRTYETNTHVPTIKCHEEVMSKLSSCTNEDCIGDPGSCVEHHCHSRKYKNKKNKVRTVTSKCNLGLHQSTSVPGSRVNMHKHEDLAPKTDKSKSTPIVQTPNHEDSVDFIPVKLTTANDHKLRPSKKINHHFEPKLAISKKASKLYRPTWDEILRNNLEVVSKPDKSSSKKALKPDRPVCNNCHSEHSSSSTPKKKVSLKETDSCHKEYEVRQDCPKRTTGFSKSVETPNSEEQPVFQHLNSSDPIKTLDFLIRQLRDGLFSQPKSDSLQNIILDMENALLKISVEKKSDSDNLLDRNTCRKEIPVAAPPHSVASSSSCEKVRKQKLDIAQLEQNLERSCRYLQSLCIKQKESCNNHVREKEQLSLQLAESRRLLAVSKTKEKNYEVTIGDLRLKLQEANTKVDQLKQSLQDLENKNGTLKEENQAMTSLKESLKRVGARLKQIASEKEKLQSKLSLKDLEIEKLKVLLQVKTSQNDDLMQDNKLLPIENELDIKLSDEEKNLSMISLSTVTSWSERPGLMCSSQASSSPRQSPSPYNSWQHISSIVQQPTAAADINRGIINILEDFKKKSEQLEPLRLDLQNPSSCSSLWSDKEAIISKVVYSDGESEGFSS